MAENYSKGYQKALLRIKENNNSKNIELVLTGLELDKLPPDITKLSHLKILNMSSASIGSKSNDFKTLPKEVTKLKNLRDLYLSNTQINKLPKEIVELENLESLYLFNTQIKELPKEITELKNLEDLYLDGTQIKELPKEITELKNLQVLSLTNTQIKELPREIAELKNLLVLYLDSTQIKELPREIAELKDLQFLSLNNTPIKELPKEMTELENLRELYLYNTGLNLPPEILERQYEPQIILNYYFENALGKDRPLNEVKMLLLGEGEVGKTALVGCLIKEKYEKPEKTDGIDIHKWNVEIWKQKNIRINVWDFGGQEIMHATHQFFLTRRSLYLLVLASRGDEKSNRLEEWLKLIQNLGGDSPVIIVCNKSDECQMTLDERALREKYPNICQIVRVSCMKGQNLKRLKQQIVGEIKKMPHVFDPFSKKWFAVKEKLENLKENYIPFDDYLKICDEEGVTENLHRETLIKFLHDLGVVLNFLDDPRVNETSVLKPEWITEGVYKILTSKMLDDKHGVLTMEMVEKILDNRRYPKHKHRFIVQMMEKFERCFQLKKAGTFLVPDLLPKQQPDFGNWKPEKTGLGFQYQYEIEPSSFITRFIVNMNEYIDEEIYWRKGVVLKNADGNKALVKADLEDKKIFIWIDGKMETRRGFLSIIRRQFKKIHETISNLRVTEFVQHKKGLIPYQSLLRLEEKGIKKHYFPDIDAEVDITEMLNGFESVDERMNVAIGSNYFRSKYLTSSRELVKEYEIDLMSMQYDVALSFAGEDRWYVSKVAGELKDNNIKVFYDEYEQVNLWGKNLFDELDDIYRNRSQYVVIFISEHYAEKMWTNHERQSAFDNAIQEKKEYVLPARFDDTELKGLRKTVGYINLENMTPKDFAQLIIRKLKNSST